MKKNSLVFLLIILFTFAISTGCRPEPEPLIDPHFYGTYKYGSYDYETEGGESSMGMLPLEGVVLNPYRNEERLEYLNKVHDFFNEVTVTENYIKFGGSDKEFAYETMIHSIYDYSIPDTEGIPEDIRILYFNFFESVHYGTKSIIIKLNRKYFDFAKDEDDKTKYYIYIKMYFHYVSNVADAEK